MTLTLIVARSRNGVIGRDGDMPWHLPADLKYFKAQTLAKPVVMGRKTFESIGRPLPGRRNIVITRNGEWRTDGVDTVADVDTALAATADAPEVMIIGGGEIYRQTISRADRLLITEIDAEIDGDTRFPDVDPAIWAAVARADHEADGGNPPFSFVEYRRVSR